MSYTPVDQWTDLDYLRRAYINARDLSDDPSTQNGAVLAPKRYPESQLVYGANRLPRGINIPKEVIATWPKKKKYRWMSHAERNVIHLAGLRGTPTHEATLFCPWFACTDCARAIIDAGITRVVGHKQMRDKLHPTWMDEIEEADVMLDQAGVRREYLDADLFDSDPAFSVLFRGELWIP
jgi:dCMP deaminase